MDYKATLALECKRKNVVNDGDAPEVSLIARYKLCISSLYVIIDNLRAEKSGRGQVYNDIADRFSCLVNVPETSYTKQRVQYCECCEELINVYPEDLNSNLFTELQQFHSYILHMFGATKSGNTRFSHAELYEVMVKDNIESAYPNVEISLLIFLSLMATNCSAERSFYQLNHINNQNRTRQEKLDSLSLQLIEAELLHKINFDDIIKDFARHKCKKKEP